MTTPLSRLVTGLTNCFKRNYNQTDIHTLGQSAEDIRTSLHNFADIGTANYSYKGIKNPVDEATLKKLHLEPQGFTRNILLTIIAMSSIPELKPANGLESWTFYKNKCTEFIATLEALDAHFRAAAN